MFGADNALLYEIARANRDPDPRRAAYYRPFASIPAAAWLTAAPPKQIARFDTGNVTEFLHKVTGALSHLLPVQRTVPVPCC